MLTNYTAILSAKVKKTLLKAGPFYFLSDSRYSFLPLS